MNQMEMEYLISRYADNTLSEPERLKARQLIDSNPDCKRWLTDHQHLQEVLNDWSCRLPMLDWDAFDSAVAKKIDQKIDARDTSVVRVRQWLGAAAVAGIVAIVVATTWLTRPPARKDVPSFIQHPRSIAVSDKIPASPIVSATMQPLHTGKPAATVKAITHATKPPAAKLPHSLALDAVKPKVATTDKGLGVAPEAGSSRHLSDVADVTKVSSKAGPSPR